MHRCIGLNRWTSVNSHTGFAPVPMHKYRQTDRLTDIFFDLLYQHPPLGYSHIHVDKQKDIFMLPIVHLRCHTTRRGIDRWRDWYSVQIRVYVHTTQIGRLTDSDLYILTYLRFRPHEAVVLQKIISLSILFLFFIWYCSTTGKPTHLFRTKCVSLDSV